MDSVAILRLWHTMKNRLLGISDQIPRIPDNPSKGYCLGFSILLNIVLFGIFFLWMNPAFETNDDVRMMLGVSGISTGVPSEYMMYTNVIIGIILKFLYTQLPGINWYTFYLYAAHYLAMSVILYSIVQLRMSWLRIFQYVLLCIFIEYPLLMILQFTSTAFVVALSGFCLLLSALQSHGAQSWRHVVVSALLLVLAGLIREAVFYGAMLLIVPVLILKFWGIQTLKIPVCLGVSGLLFFIVIEYNRQYYAGDPSWKEYYTSNKLRGRLHAYPKLKYNEQTRHVFDAVGWSENDVLLFQQGLFFDQKIFSVEKMEYIDNNLKNQRSWREILDVLYGMLGQEKIITIFTPFFLFLSIAYSPKNQRKFMYGMAIVAAGMCLALAYSARLPFRIFIPIMMFVNTACILFNSDLKLPVFDEIALNKKIVYSAAVAIVLFFMLPVNFLMIRYWNKVNQENTLGLKEKLQYLSPGRDNLYIVWTGGMAKKTYNIAYTSPYSDLKEYQNLNLLLTGWSTNSPINERMKARFGIDNVYLSFEENKNIFLVMNNQRRNQDMISTYMMEHYRQKIRFDVVKCVDDMCMVKLLKVDSTIE
jgi:hypothetical protein